MLVNSTLVFCPPDHCAMLRSKNIFIVPVLILLMLASVCQPALRYEYVLIPVMQTGGCVMNTVYFFLYAPLVQHDKLRLSALYVPVQ
jgi:hypothetical protein